MNCNDSKCGCAAKPIHAALPGNSSSDKAILEDDPADPVSESNDTQEASYAINCKHRDRQERESFSSSTSYESASTNITVPDSDAGSEPESLFDKHTDTSTCASEAQTWGSSSTNSGDRSINSVPSLPVGSEFSEIDMSNRDDYRYIPNLDNLPESLNMDHDPAPGTRSHLPCPFKWDGCEVRYDIAEKRKWIFHSLKHFGNVKPPAHLICTYGDCPERFVNEKNTMSNWKNRMEHYARHVEERLEQLRDQRGWAENDDLDVEGLGLLAMEEKVDINFQQYMIHHGANSIGLDLHINPKPRSELDNIPLGYMNRMPPAYGGRRFREVVYPPYDDPVETNLDSRSAGAMFVRDSRKTGKAAKVLAARTSGVAFRPSRRPSRPNNMNEASERIIQR